jgi:hypothetical protein
MRLSRHLALTGVAAAALAPFLGGREILAFSVGSVLIDVDHYFLYVLRTRRFGIRGMFRYFHELERIVRTLPYTGICLFHTAEFFLLLGVLAFHFPAVRPLFAGCLFHFVIDLVALVRQGIPFIRPYCLLEHAIRRRAKGYPWH